MAAVAMQVEPPPAPHAAKRPVKKTQKKRERVICPMPGCSGPGPSETFSPRLLLHHLRSTHRNETQVQSKTKEIEVYVALQAAGIDCERLKGIDFPYIRGIDYCSMNCERGTFVDFAITTHWGIILLHIDERQHARQSPERDLARDCKSYESFDGRKVAILRYNPDEFHIDGKKVQVETPERHRRLVEVLCTWMAKDYVPEKSFQRFFMYYDGEVGSNLPLAAEGAWSHKFSAVIPMRA